MSDGYLIIRRSTLGHLIECAKSGGGLDGIPHKVLVEIGELLPDVEAPEELEDRLAAVGPLLSFQEHVELLKADPDVDLPRTAQSEQFWHLVTQVTLSVLRNEAAAVRRIIAEKTNVG